MDIFTIWHVWEECSRTLRVFSESAHEEDFFVNLCLLFWSSSPHFEKSESMDLCRIPMPDKDTPIALLGTVKMAIGFGSCTESAIPRLPEGVSSFSSPEALDVDSISFLLWIRFFACFDSAAETSVRFQVLENSRMPRLRLALWVLCFRLVCLFALLWCLGSSGWWCVLIFFISLSISFFILFFGLFFTLIFPSIFSFLFLFSSLYFFVLSLVFLPTYSSLSSPWPSSLPFFFFFLSLLFFLPCYL